MLTRLARLSTGRSWRVVIAAVLFVLVAGAFGGGVAEDLTTGGFEDPSTESSRADEALAERFGTGTPNVVLLVTATGGDVDSPDAAAAGTAVTDELAAAAGVTDVVSYWSEGNAPPLRNDDGSRALVIGRIEGDDDVVDARIEELGPRLEQAGDAEAVTVEVGGFAQVFHEVGTTIEEDLLTAEMIALPITLVLLVLIFGSLVAASLPLIVGVMSIIGTFFVLQVLANLTDVSVYALNLTTALGLGLAIDYSLFIVSRFREELRAGHDPRPAVIRTVRTAGRTVTFNALTVAASLCALLVFPIAFLRSFAYAGLAVAVLAGLFSVVVLPAILALLGHRVNALTLWRRSVAPPENGVWHRMATFVMRRPIPVATAAIAVLLVLGAPFLNLRLTQPDDRVLPPGSDGRVVGDVVRDEFSSEEAGALSVVTEDGPFTPAETEAYAAELAVLPGVARVDAATGTYCAEGVADQFGCQPGDLVLGPETSDRYAGFTNADGSYLSVVPAVEPFSPEGEDLVHAVRDADAPAPVLVTGQSAGLVDVNGSLFGRLPWALGLIALITAVVLFLMFGSVVIPLKAIVLNLLSLTATFGAMVWIFQEGHLSGVLDFTATGGLAAAMPILMFCIAFGLSMDYEVFLLSRIKEEHDAGADNVTSVATGLERTGRIVTAAAVLMAVIFLAFATGHVSFIKMFGIGLTLAVVMDAFLIRGTLVPAFMRLAGEWNWWAPAPLRRLHDRFGISETVDLDGDEASPDLVAPGPAPARAAAVSHSPGRAFDDPARDPGGVTGDLTRR
ncbi:MAG TPA: MMPL family transporter [Acidimicrobiales bacterium]|nr:MMPL family transporter [Acidimicrobiales bacterium]